MMKASGLRSSLNVGLFSARDTVAWMSLAAFPTFFFSLRICSLVMLCGSWVVVVAS
jgi:hypothetical protein